MSWQKTVIGRVDFFVPFDEVPYKQRPRLGKNGAYTPRKTVMWERTIQQEAVRWCSEWATFPGTVHMRVCIKKPLPASCPKRWYGKDNTVKPDVDNVAKLVMDALNGVAYMDDKQVTELQVRRLQYCKPEQQGGLGVGIDYIEDRWVNDERRKA